MRNDSALRLDVVIMIVLFAVVLWAATGVLFDKIAYGEPALLTGHVSGSCAVLHNDVDPTLTIQDRAGEYLGEGGIGRVFASGTAGDCMATYWADNVYEADYYVFLVGELHGAGPASATGLMPMRAVN